MLGTLIRNLARRTAGQSAREPVAGEALRLHIGGQVPHPEWKVLNVQPGEHVDFVAHCTDLSRFGDESVAEIYASHVLEHLGYQTELHRALHEFRRVLVPGGTLRISVPDLTTLCALFLDPRLTGDDRHRVMRMMFGGQIDADDFHYVGLNEGFLAAYLEAAGFGEITRVHHGFGIFEDTSALVFKDRLISLNLVARKPLAGASAAAQT